MNWKRENFSAGILTIKAESWRGFIEYIQNELSNYRAYIYRGQRGLEPLEPSLDRIDGINVPDPFKLLEAFKKASRGRRTFPAKDLTDDEWWALGQEHKLKTPLLDWTESPFVASFFAFEERRKSEELPNLRAVYAIAKQKIETKSKEIMASGPVSVLIGFDAIEIISPQVDDNSRLINQSGLFTKKLGWNRNIETWVSKHFKNETDAVMIKIIIGENVGEREEFLRFLNRMNINHLTLFPDLDGAAKYCNMRFEIKDY
jgi:hypothetical protein